jgi:hypothetical protein
MSAEIDQLNTQQAILTDSLRQMIEGHWVGFPSLQANLDALSPGIMLDPHPPVLTSDAGPPPPRYAWNPNEPQIGQLYNWTCSACATEYVERASGAARGGDIYANRDAVVSAIGYTGNINATYGLMDGSGAQLQRVLSEHAGIETHQGWLDFDTAYAIYSQTFGLGSGGAFYHWVAFRGVDDDRLWIANSAEGYKSIYSHLSRDDFNRLGPWSCLWAI